jgi:pimeloyl-ACP methyl ester carboxylesterase
MTRFALPPPPGKFVVVRGIRVHYEEDGDPGGPPLLLVHGLMSSTAVWAAPRAVLAQRFRLLMPDLVGHGYSERREDFSMALADQAEVVLALLDTLGIERTAVLGHSMGGGVAALLAAHHPERVERLILADSVCYPFPMPLKARLGLIPGLGRLIVTRLYRKPVFNAFIRNDVFFDKDRINHRMVDVHYAHLNTPIARRGVHRAMQALDCPEDLAREIPNIRCPTLILWGAQDRLLPLTLTDRLKRDIPGAVLEVLDRCGHELMTEQAEPFTRAVERFLGS